NAVRGRSSKQMPPCAHGPRVLNRVVHIPKTPTPESGWGVLPRTFKDRGPFGGRMPESEYEVELFRKQGFTRQTCAKCATPFWSLGTHETCGEAPCQEYDLIGASPFKKKLTYRAMREDF